MGMFDIFEFGESLYCSICGEEHNDIQSKDYGCGLVHYKVGDKCKYVSKEFDGNEIREEECICWSKDRSHLCNQKLDRMECSSYSKKFYIIFKDYKYIGVAPTLYMAEEMLELDSGEYYFNFG
jgi:hypothetical protein